MNYEKLTNHWNWCFLLWWIWSCSLRIFSDPDRNICLWVSLFTFLSLHWNQLHPIFFFIRTFSCVQIVIVISNTTNKQQGAYQHLIYLHAQQQLCIFFLLHIKFIFMIFFSLSRKMLHIYSFLWLARKPSHLKCLVMCDLETLLKWQISFLSDFITGDAKNFGRG